MSNAEHKCPICGKPTSVWYGNARKDGLCREHAQMLREGKLVQCPNCGTFHLTNEECKCKKNINSHEDKSRANIEMATSIENNPPVEKQITKNEISKGKCLTCSNTTTADYLFCPECYHKYKDKTLLLKVEKCLTIEILDESYEGVYGCDDGHIVKSMAEREIDDYLYANGIRHSYEPLYGKGIGKGKKPIKPDFRLENYLGPNEDVYLEYWGYDESYKEYTARKNYKLNIYKENKETVISLSAKNDVKYLKFSLQQKLNKDNINIHEINED